ncbi:MAG TPA: hypothetical protein VFQ76_13310, partial [Longimicrobiaceae bacterium]|nr:hypothetical protein [Longimicrobiaceae bacterium]
HVPVEHVVAEDDGGVVAVEVVGSLGHARFPDLCVKCGTPADRTLAISKLFYHDNGDSPGHFYASGVDAPACPACMQAHERELRPIAPEVRSKLLRKWALESLPFVFPLGVNLWILTIFVPKALEAAREGTDPVEVAIWGGVSAFFGLLALMFWGLIMKKGRPLILSPADTYARWVKVEKGPLGSRFVAATEPTPVMRAVDFTADVSEMFEPERHRFTFRNYEVAARFGELNADREWDPASTRAQLAVTGRKALIGLVVLGVIYALVAEFFL